MKLISRLAALAALAAAATLSACDSTSPGPLRLDMSLEKSALGLDDSVRVSLTLRNMSFRPVMVLPVDAYGLCGARAFEVFDASYRPVSLYGGFCVLALVSAIPSPIALAPGAELVVRDWWHPARSALGGGPLRPGIYHVRGRVTADRDVVRTPLRQVFVGE